MADQGRFLDDYEIKGTPLGTGGMATVYLVVKDGKKYAAKVLHQHLNRDRKTVSRFKKEFEIGQTMKANPAFVQMLEQFKTTDGNCWTIIMEYIPGKTLHDVFKKLRRLSTKEAIAFVYDLAKSLDGFHKNNFVHRDLKPDNIIVCPDGSLKIMDYGVTRDLDNNMTKTGTAVGTPLYMAPEQICGSKSTDCRCDLYSLGLILYRLLSGRDAHGMPAKFEFMELVEARMKKPVRKIRNFENEDVMDFIDKCLQPDPDERFTTSAEFCAALGKLDCYSSNTKTVIKKTLKAMEEKKKPKQSTAKATVEQNKKGKSLLFKLVVISGATAALTAGVALALMGPAKFIEAIKSLFS